MFQKNLVVWKHCSSLSCSFLLIYRVSEELSSVETKAILDKLCMHGVFQKNLVVWKQKKTIDEIILVYKFQKNLVVWKLFSAISLFNRSK